MMMMMMLLLETLKLITTFDKTSFMSPKTMYMFEAKAVRRASVPGTSLLYNWMVGAPG